MPRDDKATGWAVELRAYDFDTAVYAVQFLAACSHDSTGGVPHNGRGTAAAEHPAGFAACLAIVADALQDVHAAIRPSEYDKEPAGYPIAAALAGLARGERAAAVEEAFALLREEETPAPTAKAA